MNSKLFTLLLSFVVLSTCADPNWADQSNWDGQCNKATSVKQSPINLTPQGSKLCGAQDLTHIKLSCTQFGSATGEGAKYVVQAPGSGTVLVQSTVDGSLVRGVGAGLQLHFHTPSEHTIKGKSYELEMHVVFQSLEQKDWENEIKNLIVPGHDSDQLATMFTTGDSIRPAGIVVGFVFEADTSISDTDVIGLTAGKTNLQSIFGCTTNRLFYRYSGSFTTPPCTEGAQWFVYREPIKLSRIQLDAIKAKVTQNTNRNIQTTGSRTVRVIGEACSLLNR